ncbi:MAG: MATE family efflux transporter [Gemmatimonadales bacterium]
MTAPPPLPLPGVPGALTHGPLRPVILRLASPAVGMMGCHFTFNLIDMLWVGRLLGPAALAAVSTGGAWRSVPTALHIGTPLSFAGVLLSLIYVWLTRYTAGFGTAALAALGIGHKMEGLGFIAITVGQSLGAGQEDRARRAVWLTVGYCLVVTATTAVAFLAVPRTLVALFTTDPAVIAAGSLYLRIISIAQIGQSFELILEGALAGAGYMFWPMVVSTGLTAPRIPLAAWWSGAFGLVGIWWALSLTATSRGVATVVFWRSGAWTSPPRGPAPRRGEGDRG